MVAGRFFLETILTINWDEFLSILWWSLNPSILIIAIGLLFFRLYWGNISITKRALRPGVIKSRVRITDPASYVGWVCCWFSSRSMQRRERSLNARAFLNEFLWSPWCSVGKQIVLHFTLSFPLRDCKATHILLFPFPPRRKNRPDEPNNVPNRIRGAEVCYFLVPWSTNSPTVLALRFPLQRPTAKKCIVWPVLRSSSFKMLIKETLFSLIIITPFLWFLGGQTAVLQWWDYT